MILTCGYGFMTLKHQNGGELTLIYNSTNAQKKPQHIKMCHSHNRQTVKKIKISKIWVQNFIQLVFGLNENRQFFHKQPLYAIMYPKMTFYKTVKPKNMNTMKILIHIIFFGLISIKIAKKQEYPKKMSIFGQKSNKNKREFNYA